MSKSLAFHEKKIEYIDYTVILIKNYLASFHDLRPFHFFQIYSFYK